MSCPKCGCPFIEQTAMRAANGYSAWKDVDGTWYNGPAYEHITRQCGAHCGWWEKLVKKRGKLVSQEDGTDPKDSL